MTDGSEDEFESRIIGDSIVRGMLSEFCARCPGKRKRFCIPGARLNDITAARDDVTQDGDRNTLYIIHAGTNDIQYSNPDELLAKYKLMIQRFKMKTDRLVISGILPRIHANRAFYGKAYSINNQLKSLCSRENVGFVNMWDNFYNESSLFQDDGLHLNSVGSARLGRLFSDQVALYKSKNGGRLGASPTT